MTILALLDNTCDLQINIISLIKSNLLVVVIVHRELLMFFQHLSLSFIVLLDQLNLALL